MSLTSIRDAAKKVFGGEGGSALPRRFGALLLAVCLLASIPMDASAAGESTPDPTPTDVISETGSDGGNVPEGDPAPTEAPTETGEGGGDGYEIALISGIEETVPGQLGQFRTKLSITDENGTEVENGGIVYTGSKYTIHLEFEEKGPGKLQMLLDDNGQLHYQLPNIFETTPMSQPLIVKIVGDDGQMQEVTVGNISVDENGMVTVQVDEAYRHLFTQENNIYNLNFSVDIEGTAGELQEGQGHDYQFDDAGEEFHVTLMDHPKVTAEKEGKFTENEDHSGGKLEYTVKTKVEHGQLNDGVITDELTPPNNTDAFTLEIEKNENGVPDVKVTLKRGGQDIELGPDDYDLIPDTDTADGKQTFTVRLKDAYNPLLEGDELDVTYTYDATLKESSLNEFWGNVENDVTVTGRMPVDDPQNPGKMLDVDVEEHAGSNEEIRVTYGGRGVVSKAQDYSEATHTLHYTLYTVIPEGEWEPLFVYDDMYVQYEGERWYLLEFKDDGRVKDVKVHAKDLKENWVSADWDSLTDEQKAEYVKDLSKEGAEKIQDLPFDGWHIPNGYAPVGPGNMKQCARYYSGKSLYVVFGLENNDKWGSWGHWEYDKDRLIITEYDLDMSTKWGDTITLFKDPDHPDTSETLKLSPEQVLHAGITNNVNLRFGSYFPGYSVFFNNAEPMNKTGAVNAEDNTITWTVTMNTTDTTVNRYFQDVLADWMAQNAVDKHNWDIPAAYADSMQAVFYDELPEGWEYVEGSLTATACGRWGNEASYPYDENGNLNGHHDLVTQDGDKQAIRAPLMVFFNSENKDRPNLFNWFGGDMVSLTFTYKLKATDEWLETHQYKLEGYPIKNHAEIKDKNISHWKADAQVTYFPPQLTKKAEVIGKGMLKFTLEVNPQGVKLGDGDTLTVKDTSTNLTIDPETIEVKDAAGNNVAFNKTVTDGHFELEVPNGIHLFVTYLATIDGTGTAEEISNTASINGIVGGGSSYSDTFDVDKMTSGGAGASYSMTVRKVDASDENKQLAGAEFEYYMVLEEGDNLTATKEIEVGGEKYPCYQEDGMTVTTTADGGKASTRIGQGYYYIFVETKAPEGYVLDPTPILVYFGEELPSEAPRGTILVKPRGDYSWLTVPNTPERSLQVVKVNAASQPDKEDYYLAGAKFELKGPDGSTWTGESRAEDGLVTWTKEGTEAGTELKQLPAGVYDLTETEAPDGYNKLEDPITFTVDEDGSVTMDEQAGAELDTSGTTVIKILISNESGYVLPESGGVGTAWLYGLGTALILTAAMALVCDSRRRVSR